ncbi:helix-turn-helix domain-containing protein [Fodinisporobacter ferrooxydans]|uniref:Helix-turn-helix domain-containing protein n=1 Tax=Fodinisporobacter ferrooxydans TaxID=2901836 RepID=A0ABY4CDW0_9BACL|nr:helix-turn-helix domain-containing protein [Alicyclobacillaceae bacterium MYW30-H2]
MILLRVAKLIQQNKLNQKQLAQLTGIHPITISKIKRQLKKEQRLEILKDTAVDLNHK